MIWAGLAFLGLAVLFWPFITEWRKPCPDDKMRGRAPGGFADLPQGKTHYRWFGPEAGPVVVCVHGLTTPSRVYESIAEDLASNGYRVLTYDHYGRGYSDNAQGLQDEAFFNKHLNDLLMDQNVSDPAVFIGYSMGGAVVTCFAAHNPEKVKHAILLAPAGMGVSSNSLRRVILRSGLLGDWLMLSRYPALHIKGTEAERALPSSVPGIIDYQQNELKRRGFVPAVLSSIRGILSKPLEAEHRKIFEARVRLLAIFGAQDALIPTSATNTLRQWNPEAETVIVNGAGHGLPYTHTGEVLAELHKILPHAEAEADVT